MKKSPGLLLLGICFVFFASCNKDDDTGKKETITTYEGWELVWNDEFEGSELNTLNWTYEIGDGTDYGLQPGWGNNEKQIYTNDKANSCIAINAEGHSVLEITAIRTISGSDTSYSSAKLTTQNLQTFRFGKIEARIKLPSTQGMWPAFWMLGTNYPTVGWPGCGEVDILEMLGGHEEIVHGNVHYVADYKHEENLGTSTLSTGKYSDDYHIYTLEWSPDMLTWSIDGVQFHEQEVNADMKEYLRSFYLILNVAVGGYWPGDPDETTVFPQKMYVDYVRVYKDVSLDPPAEPELIIEDETMGAPSIDARVAINQDFSYFMDIDLIQYGAEVVELTTSNIAVNGDKSIKATYPVGNWGGLYFQLASAMDMTAYADGKLVAALKIPDYVTNFEVKLESTGGFGSLNLLDYPSIEIDENFKEYSIPLADFVALGLNLDKLTIPFALWNPMDENGAFLGGEVLIDNIRFEL